MNFQLFMFFFNLKASKNTINVFLSHLKIKEVHPLSNFGKNALFTR